MVFIGYGIDVRISEAVRRFGQSAVVTGIATLLALIPRSNGNRICNRAWLLTSLITLFPASSLLAAQESPHLASATFEMATIKPSKRHAQGNTFRVSGHRFETRNTSLRDLIAFAYSLHPKQITNAPDWVEAAKYDLTALSGADSHSSETLWKGMLQKYLVEYFKLSFHRDTLEQPLYVLTICRTGPKLTRSKGDPNRLPGISVTLGATNFANVAAVIATNANMADLARVMQRLVLDWPVLDQTGIVGKYDFALNWTPDGSQFGDARSMISTPTDDGSAPADLFTAIQQQIGLKLEVVRASSEVLVIDLVEKPDN